MQQVVKYIEEEISKEPGYKLFKFRRIQFPQWSYLFCKKHIWLPINEKAIAWQGRHRNILYLDNPKIAFNNGYRLEV